MIGAPWTSSIKRNARLTRTTIKCILSHKFQQVEEIWLSANDGVALHLLKCDRSEEKEEFTFSEDVA
jgi:hypothetical protein